MPENSSDFRSDFTRNRLLALAQTGQDVISQSFPVRGALQETGLMFMNPGRGSKVLYLSEYPEANLNGLITSVHMATTKMAAGGHFC